MAYYTISKNSGVCLNEQKTDFNTKLHHVAKFASEEEAQSWIDENSHLFKSVTTGKPVKLRINKHDGRGGADRGQGRKSREELGQEPVKNTTVQVEPSVIEACKKKHGSLANALRFAASHN